MNEWGDGRQGPLAEELERNELEQFKSSSFRSVMRSMIEFAGMQKSTKPFLLKTPVNLQYSSTHEVRRLHRKKPVASVSGAPLESGQSRAGNGVAADLGVDVDENAWVGGLVEGGRRDTAGRSGAAAGDLNVDALGDVSKGPMVVQP